MGFLRDTWHLFGRLLRATVRMPVFVVISIVQPILWVLVFGRLFQQVATIPGFEGSSYMQFLAPGIAILTALMSSSFSGMGLLADIDNGVLDRMLASPVARGSLIACRLFHASTQTVVQAIVILAVAIASGARPSGGILGVLVVLLAAGLLGAAFAGFSNALALLTRRQELVIAAMNFTTLPLLFTSSMLMSHSLMPAWIRAIARLNPVNWAVTAARDGFEAQRLGEMARDLGLLVLFTLLCATLATRAFRRYQASL